MPFPAPGDLPDPGIEPASLACLASAGGFFTVVTPGKPMSIYLSIYLSIFELLCCTAEVNTTL